MTFNLKHTLDNPFKKASQSINKRKSYARNT
jgi:hypothetical protein